MKKADRVVTKDPSYFQNCLRQEQQHPKKHWQLQWFLCLPCCCFDVMMISGPWFDLQLQGQMPPDNFSFYSVHSPVVVCSLLSGKRTALLICYAILPHFCYDYFFSFKDGSNFHLSSLWTPFYLSTWLFICLVPRTAAGASYYLCNHCGTLSLHNQL